MAATLLGRQHCQDAARQCLVACSAPQAGRADGAPPARCCRYEPQHALLGGASYFAHAWGSAYVVGGRVAADLGAMRDGALRHFANEGAHGGAMVQWGCVTRCNGQQRSSPLQAREPDVFGAVSAARKLMCAGQNLVPAGQSLAWARLGRGSSKQLGGWQGL